MSQEQVPEFREEAVRQEVGADPMTTPPQQELETVQNLKELEESLDRKSYFLGEVPQTFLVDPQSFLPLNSDRLGTTIEKLQAETASLIQEEVTKIQALQKKLHVWEERIERNKAIVASNQTKTKQNLTEIAYDKKNRDYWWGRAEQVMLDFAHAETSNRMEDWNWLIKKYGLKNSDRTLIYASSPTVAELCNKSVNLLVGDYKTAGNRYEILKNAKEAENNNLLRENSRLKTSNETLQGFITATYTSDVEPLQDGILLLKELSMKLKSLTADSTYGELRSWAETFLNDFLRANHRVGLNIVTEFRKLTSIPLPPTNC
jgi:hypothetical protein